MSNCCYTFEPSDASTFGDLKNLLISIVGPEVVFASGATIEVETKGVFFDDNIQPALEKIGFTGSVTFVGGDPGHATVIWVYEVGQRSEEEEIEDPYYACRDYTFAPNDPSALEDLLGSLASIAGVDGIQDGAIPASGIPGHKFDNVGWGRGEVSEALEKLNFTGTVTVHGDPPDQWLYRSGKKIAAGNGYSEWDLE